MRFSELVDELEARLRARNDPEAFFECAPEIFATVLDNRLHVKAANELLAAVRDRNLHITALITSGQFIALHTSLCSSWAIIFHQVPTRFLYLSPVDVLQARIGGGEASVTRYSCAEPDAFDRLQPDLELAADAPLCAPIGKVFTRHGRREILDWRTAEEEKSPGATLRVNGGLRADFEWAFDRTTRRAVGLSGMDPVRSNLATIFSLLASIGDPSSIAHLQPFLSYDKHFVRWGAAQAIAAIDRDEGMTSVIALADDPHAEVRAAARKSLERVAA